VDEPALNAIIKDLYALYDGSQGIDVTVDAAKVAPIAHGWYTRVRRTGRALQVLTAEGFEHEGAPLRRSLIEHALGLHWLADGKDSAVDALHGGNQNTWKKISDSMTDGWVVTPEDLSSVVNAVLPSSSESTYLHFAHLCRRYEEPDLFVAWLLETGHSHTSYASAIAYVDFDERAEQPILLVQARHDLQTTSAVVANLLLVASIGFNKILNGQPWTHLLEELHERMGGAVSAGGQ
jgi:hypothetical protein